jgi:hypothetical protein
MLNRVSDLIDSISGEWDASLINEFFGRQMLSSINIRNTQPRALIARQLLNHLRLRDAFRLARAP